MREGIILAGGYSSRANSNKMLLPYLGKPLICHTIDHMAPYVSKIFLVTGYYHKELTEALESYPKVEIVYNENFDQGMFSSVQKGVSKTSEDFYLMPGDCPLVTSKTYEIFKESPPYFALPSFEGKFGHPLFVSKTMKDIILKEPVTSNLKEVRNRYPIMILSTSEPTIVFDVDTIQDYNQLMKEGES